MYNFKQHGLMEPLIHVGFPKALSSWMQVNLFKPENGFKQVMKPFQIQPVIINPTCFKYRADEVYASLDMKISESKDLNNKVPVITSEALSGNLFCGGYNAKELADRVVTAFPDARILIIVREQKSMIRALYNTQILWGLPHSIERMLVPVVPSMSSQFSHDYLRYDEIVNYYMSQLGKDRVLVLPYELFQQAPDKFIASIYEFSGAHEMWSERVNQLPFEKRINKGVPLVFLKLLRL
ncbi:MAG: sulfotransferase, partial [Thiotrichaceae bacterium]|nr:sulfotransferase [Thiotrichaceae bacterium]